MAYLDEDGLEALWEDVETLVGGQAEQAVPLMSANVRGGAKLDEDGGLAVEDGSLKVAWFYYDEDEDLCQA